MGENIATKTWSVYIHTNKINNKVYIGITSMSPYERWGCNGCNYQKRQQPAFAAAIKKYGWENFEHIIFAEDLTEEEAKHMEKLLIALYKSNCRKYKNPSYGYNMTDGGDGTVGRLCTAETKRKIGEANRNPPEETRRKMREARLGTRASDETKRKMSEASKNRPRVPHSEETKKKMSEIAKERLKDPKNNPMFGKRHTDESKKRIGDGHRNPSVETRMKMSESAKARCTDEWRQEVSKQLKGKFAGNKNPNAKYVYQYSSDWNLIKTWETLKDVANEFNVTISTVSGTWLKNSDRLYRDSHWSLINIETIQNDYEVAI